MGQCGNGIIIKLNSTSGVIKDRLLLQSIFSSFIASCMFAFLAYIVGLIGIEKPFDNQAVNVINFVSFFMLFAFTFFVYTSKNISHVLPYETIPRFSHQFRLAMIILFSSCTIVLICLNIFSHASK